MTKTEMKARCKGILHKLPIGSKLDDADQAFMIDIFERHPEWDQKRGCGIDFITTKRTDYGNTCFMIYRIDGSNTDISYIAAVDGRSDLANIRKACRYAVDLTIREFRDKTVVFGKTVCPFTGEILTKENTHIDHYDCTFEEVVQSWLLDKSVSDLAKKINQTTDGSIDTFFVDSDISLDFVRFHNDHTHLRAVSIKANLSLLKKTS